MSLRILHVLCSNFHAGSVAYAVQLATQQAAAGHEVLMLTDQDLTGDAFTCLTQPISDRSYPQRIRNVIRVKRLIREHDISVVHAHSRAASWVASYALKGSRVPLVSTIHGRQVKKRSGWTMDVYGDSVITVCPTLLDLLIDEIGLRPDKLNMIPNGIDVDALGRIERTRSDKEPVLSIIGRFNGVKGEVFATLVEEVLPQLLAKQPAIKVQLLGDGWESFPEHGRRSFDALREKYPEQLAYLGFRPDVDQFIANSDLVIGAGRVALSALFLGTPVFAIGEAQYHGMVTRSNIHEVIRSNFGDLHPKRRNFQPDSALIVEELLEALARVPFTVNVTDELVEFRHYRAYPRIMQVYRKAMMTKAGRGPIPVLMYHRVPDRPINSRHRTFVTKRRFGAHLRFFAFRGLTSITFKDYLDFADGTIPMREFPKHPFILTFDDGYSDNHRNVLPLTKVHGFKGVLFLLGDSNAEHNHWDKEEDPQVNQLMNKRQKLDFVQAGWEIGAHSMTHPDLTSLSRPEAEHEIRESKAALENELGTQVRTFAYPYGHYDDRAKELVQEAGLELGVATDTGGMRIEDDPYAVFRVNMFPEEGLLQLYKKTSQWYRAYYRRTRGK